MTRRRIGGLVDYALLADLHKPDADGVKREALRLVADGVDADTVAHALHVAPEQITTWLTEAALADEARTLAARGWHLDDIAVALNVSETQIRRWLAEVRG